LELSASASSRMRFASHAIPVVASITLSPALISFRLSSPLPSASSCSNSASHASWKWPGWRFATAEDMPSPGATLSF
jgi:hypothetical protein